MGHVKDDYYFSHDQNARNDMKIKAMMRKYGVEGYGRWWVLIENLRAEIGYKIPMSAMSISALADDMRTEVEQVKQYINDCVDEYDLLRTDGEYFWSESLLRRMTKMDEVRAKRSEAGKKGMKSRWNDNDVITKDNKVITKGKKKEPKAEPKPKIEGSTEVTQLERMYIALFEKRYGERPEISYARDRAILKQIVEGRGLPTAINLLTDYFQVKDEYIENSGHSIPVFKSAVNKLIAAQKKRKPTKVLDSDWVEEQRQKRLSAMEE